MSSRQSKMSQSRIENSVALTRPQLIQQARTILAELLAVETGLREYYDRLFRGNWALGSVLKELKEDVGHGHWLFWLGENWPELGDTRARRSIAFFDANPVLPNQANLTDLKLSDFPDEEAFCAWVNSVRALLGGHMPAKLRPQLEGDQPLVPVASFEAGTNRLAAMFHRIEESHAAKPPWPLVAPQARLIVEGFRKLYPDEFQKLIE